MKSFNSLCLLRKSVVHNKDFPLGLVLFYLGMAINIHSDYILRNLRKPGEVIYKIPTGKTQRLLTDELKSILIVVTCGLF